MTRPFFLYFILKAFGLTLLPSYMISIFKSVILLLKELHLSCFRTVSFILASFPPTRLEALDPIQTPCRSVRFSQACIRLCSIYVP